MKFIYSLLFILFLSSCSSSSTNIYLKSITLFLDSNKVIQGSNIDLKTYANYSDDTSNLIDNVIYTSDDYSCIDINGSIAIAKNIDCSTNIRVDYYDKNISFESLFSDTKNLEVFISELKSVSISPVLKDIGVGEKQTLVVNGVFENGLSQDISSNSKLSSNDVSIAKFNDLELDALKEGDINISVETYGKTFSDFPLSVVSAKLKSVSISYDGDLTLSIGDTKQLSSLAIYSDQSQKDISNTTQWKSSDENLVSVSSSGLLTSLDDGVVQISSTYNSISSSVNVTSGSSEGSLTLYRYNNSNPELTYFPYDCGVNSDCNNTKKVVLYVPSIVSTYILEAKGRNYTIKDLKNGGTQFYFDGLKNGDIIRQDVNKTFKLMINPSNLNVDSFEYSFGFELESKYFFKEYYKFKIN